ncbi:MAG: hypothetical protein Q8N05_07135 [Bacteroidota bacterium]|nr:hypothetical protein [Bacteroidota bacterium]
MKTTILFISFIFIFIIGTLSVHSQVTVTNSEILLDKLRLNKGINGTETATYSTINGSPFLNSEFVKGQITLISGEKSDANLRYDVYANEMQIKEKSEIFAIFHPEIVKVIEIDSLKFVYSIYLKTLGDENSKDASYFILKADGKCQLLIKKNMRIQDAEPAKLYQDAKPARFIPTKDTYYLKLKDENAVKIRNRKELLSVLGNQKESFSEFISLNKLSTNDIEDLFRIVSFYNGL